MASPVVACVQLDSRHADVAANVEKVERLLQPLLQAAESQPRIDLLVLPELALTGYVFDSHHDIEPLLERIHRGDGDGPPPSPASRSPDPGPTMALVARLAQRFRCHVLAGVAERGPTQRATAAHNARPPGSQLHEPPNGPGHAYNSAVLVDPAGRLVHTFRKHFLYDDDKRWATEGPGFETVELPGIGKVCVAICMDLNPYNFTAPFESFELAEFCREQGVKLLVVPMAWLLPASESTANHAAQEASLSSINYWALRCSPLFGPTADASGPVAGAAHGTTFFVAANRTGTEGKSTFAGSSCVLRMRPGERPELLAALGVHEEALLCAQLQDS
ncbi:hypothetical protein ACQY0O_001068 [Thecaphora frezii]